MVVILTAENGSEFAAPSDKWAAALDLAQRYGWTPHGTVRPGAWDGSYTRPCGQMIPSSDARRLATALGEALDDVPDHASAPAGPSRTPSVYEMFSGPVKRDLSALSAFLACGACTVFGACDAHGRHEVRFEAPR